MFIQKPKGGKRQLYLKAPSAERVGGGRSPPRIWGAAAGCHGNRRSRPRARRCPLKRLFALHGVLIMDVIRSLGPGPHLEEKRGPWVLSLGNGTKRPFVVQHELFLISKMWGFFLLKKETENTPCLPSSALWMQASQDGEAGPGPAQVATPVLTRAPAVRPPACRSHAACSEPKAQ